MLNKISKAVGGFISAALFTQALVGCAPMPVGAQEAKAISADRQYAYVGMDEASLVVTRDKGLSQGKDWFGRAHGIDFLIDGKRVATIWSGEVVRFGLKAGPHIIAVTTGGPLVEREINLKVGETMRRRIPDSQDLDVTPTAYK
ncbi:hypothetical protein [Pseudomonas sp. PWP3-1b2]|uniref:hypothetical protein n=1 Tax=Pseudomonas sp. PWP3-1b2 TaxID=2804656 RepID=UPI003CF5CFED